MIIEQCCTLGGWGHQGQGRWGGLSPYAHTQPRPGSGQPPVGLPVSCLVHPNPSLSQSSEWLFKDANLIIALLEQLMGHRLDSKLLNLQIFPCLVPSLVPLLTLRTQVFIFLSSSGQLQGAIPSLVVLLRLGCLSPLLPLSGQHLFIARFKATLTLLSVKINYPSDSVSLLPEHMLSSHLWSLNALICIHIYFRESAH